MNGDPATPPARTFAPTFDADCVVHLGDGSVEIPADDACAVEILVDNFDQPVDTALLAAPDADDASALHARLRRLAHRLSFLGLEIVPVPDDAFVLRRGARYDHPLRPVRPVRPVAPVAPARVASARVASARVAPRQVTPRRVVGRRPTLPMHFRTGLLAPDLP